MLAGRQRGYRETVIGPSYRTLYEVQRFCQQRSLFPPGVRIRRQYLFLFDPPEKNVELIDQFKPDIIHSHGSYLEILFAYLQDSEAPFHRPKLITYSSDGLSDSARRLIEEEFNIPVFSTYQSIEAFKIGFECEQHRGFHLNVDLYPLRIADAEGRTLPPGESGEVVVSNLVNRATVLLNYRLGDIAALLPDQCPCGRTLPLLTFVQGRSDDFVRLPSGRIVHPQAVRSIFVDEDQVWQYQVVQQTGTRFDVRIVAARAADHQRIRGRVATRFASTFGAGITVAISFVGSIPRTEAGKFRSVLSLTPERAGIEALNATITPVDLDLSSRQTDPVWENESV